jgi:hypothetical protein
MRRQITSCLMVILLCATSGAAQSSSKRQNSSPSSDTITDIRKVDFLNFTYHSSLCSQEFGKQGIGKTVRVSKGEFKNRNVYFAVEENRVIFGDVTGDGHEDAIVPIGCGATTANFSLTEVHIYTIKDGRATLLAQISDKDMERDYRGNYPDTESYWGVTGNNLKVTNGNLEIEVFADGPHASPKYMATLEYRLSGENARLVGKPQRRNSSQ